MLNRSLIPGEHALGPPGRAMNRQPTAHFLVRTLVCVQTVQLLVNANEKCCIHPLQLVISESHKKKLKRRLSEEVGNQ